MENTPKIRMSSVLWQKAARFVEAHSLRKGARLVALSFIAGLLSTVLTHPAGPEVLIDRAMTWRNYTLPVTLWVVAATFYGPRVLGWLYASGTDVLGDRTSTEGDCLIEGVPVTALVDHLVKFKTFRRDDVEKAFAIPRYRYTALVKKMKELGVLQHGLNNMSVLGEGWGREELTDLFAGKESADDLQREVRIVRPLPSPTFQKRELSRETLEETDARPARSLCATA